MSSAVTPLGVLLAGGASRRLGRPKTRARLGGAPMLWRPLGALRAALGEVVVVAKADTPLPDLPPDTPVWHEPALPRHPFCGVAAALERAGGRSVLVAPADLPFLDPETVRRLAAAPAGEVAVAADAAGRLQPLLARYGPGALAALAEAARAGRPARAAVGRLDPVIVAVEDEAVLFNVNTVEDLAEARARLSRT